MTEQFKARCEAYIREGASFVGWVHARGYGIVRTDAVQKRLFRFETETAAAFEKRQKKAKMLTLSKPGRRKVDRIIAKLRRMGFGSVRYVEYSPETGLTVQEE